MGVRARYAAAEAQNSVQEGEEKEEKGFAVGDEYFFLGGKLEGVDK